MAMDTSAGISTSTPRKACTVFEGPSKLKLVTHGQDKAKFYGQVEQDDALYRSGAVRTTTSE